MDIPVKDIDQLCEKQGFTFHGSGRGRWAFSPYWSFDKDGFSVEYHPHTNLLKITSGVGSFQGQADSVEHLSQLLGAMRIDVDQLNDSQEASKTTEFKVQRKMELAKRVASRIQQQFGFRPGKCLEMAMMGQWWIEVNRLSQMSNRIVDQISDQVIADIESGRIS